MRHIAIYMFIEEPMGRLPLYIYKERKKNKTQYTLRTYSSTVEIMFEILNDIKLYSAHFLKGNLHHNTHHFSQ